MSLKLSGTLLHTLTHTHTYTQTQGASRKHISCRKWRALDLNGAAHILMDLTKHTHTHHHTVCLKHYESLRFPIF